jgi:5-(carboxyamino)imidazole ribonucleotide synthase
MTTIGVLGAGQLGRMLALAGYPLGLRFRFLDPAPEAPAAQIAERHTIAFDDPSRLERFVQGLDLLTWEFENVPIELPRALERSVPVFPPPRALEVSQDRLVEKRFFQGLGIPTAPFVSVETREDLARGLAEIGTPAVLKTRRLGYDGKGQYRLHTEDDADGAWQALQGVPLILEGFVLYERELSIIAVRSRCGETAFYPLVENHHAGGMLRLSRAPAPHLTPQLQAQGEALARRVLTDLNYVGTLAIELFEVEGRLLANEMAPRVHNSGHWTIEGAETSQFENHLRAILDLPLGSTESVGASAMVNFIGKPPDLPALLGVTGAHVHLYGKQARPGRKLGHVTIRAPSADRVEFRLHIVRTLLREPLPSMP